MESYKIIRSNRKTISLSINKNLEVILKAPNRMPQNEVENFVNNHLEWIAKHKIAMQKRVEWEENNKLDEEQIKDLIQRAKAMIPQRVTYFANQMRVQPTNIKITRALTRWGSCSGTNRLCFSYRVMLLPAELIDYIVVHELAHIRVKNHGFAFYKEVETYMPNYKEYVKRIKKWGYSE